MEKKSGVIGVRMRRIMRWGLGGGAGLLVLLAGWLYVTVPSIDRIVSYDPKVPMRIYTADGRLIGQYGEQYRLPLPLKDIPKGMRRAFLAAEDADFYSHPGIDLAGITRALIADIRAGAFVQGGSTITQQVARTFLLSRERTISRKLRETFLAFEIEVALTKREVLHRYLNQVYLGSGAYGVQAAARTFYGRPVTELTLAERALLAGLPKGPAYYNPIRHPERARARRDYVLHQMLDAGWVGPDAVLRALETPVHAAYHPPVAEPRPMLAAAVRKRVIARYGEETAATGGLQVVTTIDGRLQRLAQEAVQEGLLAYTRRHGFRGPVAHLGPPGPDGLKEARNRLRALEAPGPLRPALVLGFGQGGREGVRALLADGRRVLVPWSTMEWARPFRTTRSRGPAPAGPRQVVRAGDVVHLRPAASGWAFSQVPVVEGALVAVDPDSGAARAVVGGFEPGAGSFNRALQARRQPGSAFKPLVYAAALARGMTPATLINDAPLVFRGSGEASSWRPENYSRTFHGPTRLREGLVHSRNLMALRVLRRTGLDYGRRFTARFGLERERLPDDLTLALGTAGVTPWAMTGAYTAFANQGVRTEPYLIERILTCGGRVLLDRHPERVDTGTVPGKHARRVMSPQVSYQMTAMLQEVVENGTGWRVDRGMDRPVGGKTGTTNRQEDAWFMGYTPRLVTGVWVGFDRPRSLGRKETGSRAASPVWTRFMARTLRGRAYTPFERPDGLIRVQIDKETGLLAESPGPGTRFEWFRAGMAPARTATTPTLAQGEEPEGGLSTPPSANGSEGSGEARSLLNDLF
ncbi:penicillin-binding protein 1A [Thiohalorhabdus sp. Cl-TMA]|uniref:Penicillin-binding protein 1A n=1 Tax=Thiohalorhabdus methylotrophus TaxID=3242694 RepID=A0ABV4TRE6_9GAMM